LVFQRFLEDVVMAYSMKLTAQVIGGLQMH
jgi:hypothetical protein